ncbi:MAG: hypothetical protein A2W23_03540 [Planctomycetes bacterium RBG_16_43_13]|nr:MAG: hypothetical protein A2W23_03540 [Planctomycetes bacterium RBG_16_43_13]
MSKYPVLKNAPIVEAVLDIRVELPEDVTLATLEPFCNSIKERFPGKKERVSFKAGFELSQVGHKVATSNVPCGYILNSLNNDKVVQARLDGFTFSKLKPYETWGALRSEARELWEHYFQITNPVKVIRIALRYINRIEIPLSMNDFKEYISTTPEIAPKLPQALSHFFMQLCIPKPDIGAEAIITETMGSPTETQRLPLIFDIDVFKITAYVGNKLEMWDEFEKLRAFKNDIFFNSITKKTEEMFK